MNSKKYILCLFLIGFPYVCMADNGHLIATAKTELHRLAVFAEPWPARIGEIDLRCIVTDSSGNLLRNPELLSIPFEQRLPLHFEGQIAIQYALDGHPQSPIVIPVLPKESMIYAHLDVWLFLIIGLIFIILREKLAKNGTRRYPSL